MTSLDVYTFLHLSTPSHTRYRAALQGFTQSLTCIPGRLSFGPSLKCPHHHHSCVRMRTRECAHARAYARACACAYARACARACASAYVRAGTHGGTEVLPP